MKNTLITDTKKTFFLFKEYPITHRRKPENQGEEMMVVAHDTWTIMYFNGRELNYFMTVPKGIETVNADCSKS